MYFKSIEEEDAWNEHLQHLANMSPAEKRRYAKMLDAQEKGLETRLRHINEDDRQRVSQLRFHKNGLIGVSRADLKR